MVARGRSMLYVVRCKAAECAERPVRSIRKCWMGGSPRTPRLSPACWASAQLELLPPFEKQPVLGEHMTWIVPRLLH